MEELINNQNDIKANEKLYKRWTKTINTFLSKRDKIKSNGKKSFLARNKKLILTGFIIKNQAYSLPNETKKPMLLKYVKCQKKVLTK